MDFSGDKRRSRSRKPAADFKVVYISTPMKVKTSASKFRSLVQKLTGQDSDAESFIELLAAAAADRNNLQPTSSAAAFLDCDNDDLLTDRKIETAAVTPAEDLDLDLQNFDASFVELSSWLFA